MMGGGLLLDGEASSSSTDMQAFYRLSRQSDTSVSFRSVVFLRGWFHLSRISDHLKCGAYGLLIFCVQL